MYKNLTFIFIACLFFNTVSVMSQETVDIPEAPQSLEFKLLEKCIHFFNERSFEKADLLLDQVIRNYPSSYRAYYMKFKIKDTIGEEDGLYFLKKAVMLYNAQKDMKILSVPDMNQEFFTELNTYLSAHTLSYKFYLEANEFLKKGKWLKAVSSLENAIKTKKRAEYYFKLGDVYVDLNEKHSAMKYYADGLTLKPGNVKTRVKLIHLYKDTGDYNNAYQEAKILMKLQGSNSLIKKMYDELSNRVNRNNFSKNLPLPQDMNKILVNKIVGRTLYLKYNGNFQEKIQDLVFKKHHIYDKNTGDTIGKILISSVDRKGLFKALLLGNSNEIKIGDYITNHVD